MAVDDYTTPESLADVRGNINARYNDSTGELNLNATRTQADVPVFIDEVGETGYSGSGFCGSVSDIPEQAAHVLIRRETNFVASNFAIISKPSDSESTPFTLYITNDLTEPEIVSFFNDEIRYPSAITGETFIKIPPGKTAVLHRRDNFKWDVFGEFEADGLTGGGGGEENSADVISYDFSRFLEFNEVGNVDWVQPWQRGLVAGGGEDIQVVKFDGTQTFFGAVDDVASFDVGAKRYVTTARKRLWHASPPYIWSIDLTNGNQSSQFLDGYNPNTESSISNWTNIAINGSLFICGTTAPSFNGNLSIARYDLDKFGTSNTNWDQSNKILLRNPSLDAIETASVDAFSYNNRLFVNVDVREDGFSDILIEVDPETLEEIQRMPLDLPEGRFQNGPLNGSTNFLYRFDNNFLAIVDSNTTGEQWMCVISDNLEYVEQAKFVDQLRGFEDPSSSPPIFPATEGGFYVPTDRFQDGANTKVFHYHHGRALLRDSGDDLRFQEQANLRSTYVAYTVSGIWAYIVDDGNGNRGFAPLGANGFVDYTRLQNNLNA
jgi:hypothetical protein